LLYNIAETYYKTKNYPKAIEYFDKILQQDASHAKAMYMMGMSYQKKGETVKGTQLCDKAIQLDPSLADLKRKKMDIGL
jgi:tetratricopeptide (TPR) repeat protein